MGRSIPSAQKLQEFARFITSRNNGHRRPAKLRPVSKTRFLPSLESTRWRHDPHHIRLDTRRMEAATSSERQRRPLAEVVADCVQRWFQDTLKEAKNGDSAMQMLVGQMYYSGYGVARDVQRANRWISRAAKSRSSAWKLGDKHPGYNATDSDSDDSNEVAK
ncbi:hypothetical protein OROGR_022682 [Orobanche gracilis]